MLLVLDLKLFIDEHAGRPSELIVPVFQGEL